MRAETQLDRGRSLSGLPEPIHCVWVDEFPAELQEEVLRLMNVVLENEDTIGFPGPLKWDEGMRLMASTAEEMALGNKHVLLFRALDGTVVGHVLLTRSSLPNCRHIGEVSRTFVHPDYRGLAVIRMGLKAVLERSDNEGIEVLQLDVRAGTRIARLWRALGFETIGIMHDYARVKGHSYSGYFMYQRVDVLRERITDPAELVPDGQVAPTVFSGHPPIRDA